MSRRAGANTSGGEGLWSASDLGQHRFRCGAADRLVQRVPASDRARRRRDGWEIRCGNARPRLGRTAGVLEVRRPEHQLCPHRRQALIAMALPRIEPIVPTLRAEPFDDPGWLFDVKYDGFRALCYLEQWRSHFVSRNGKPLSRFTALADELADVLEVDEAVLDGEVIVADAADRPQFYDLLRGRLAPAYVAFDLLWIDGVDLRPKPLSERRAVLRGLLPEGSPTIAEAVSVEGRGCELFELMRAHDLEGIVAKRLSDPYGPPARWLKIRNPGYTQAEGRAELFNRGRG